MKSTFLSLCLLFSVTQVAHGAIKFPCLTTDLSLQPNQNEIFSPLNQQKNNDDDEDGASLVPTY